MRARLYVAAFGAIAASISPLRGEYIGAPPSEAVRFMRDAEQVFIFPNPKPDKPRRDDKRMRLVTGEALRSLIRLVGISRIGTSAGTIVSEDDRLKISACCFAAAETNSCCFCLLASWSMRGSTARDRMSGGASSMDPFTKRWSSGRLAMR